MTTQSLNQYQPFLFKRVSLISVNFLRYEGNLIAIQENTNSLMLSNVKCFGTEDREVAKPIPAAQEIYEYIIFKDAQIKSLNLSNDQFIYGMNPMMYHNMPYPPNFMGGAQSFFPGFPMYYYNWPYGQMQPMNNYMQQNMNQEPRGFGEFNNPSFDMNRDLNLNVMQQNQNMNESFDVKKDVNFDGGMGATQKSNQNTFKVDSQNKPNDQTQMKLNEVQMKMGDLNLKQNEVQSKPQNDTQNKLNDVSSSLKQTEVHNQPKMNDLHKNITQEKKELKNITETKPQHDVKTQSDTKTQIDTKNSQNIIKTDTPTPKSNEFKTKERTYDEYKSSNENKYYDKNKNLDDTSYKKNYNSNNRYNNRYNNNNNGNQYNRYNGNYNNNYNKGGPRRYNNDRPNFNSDVTVDIFEATKKFEKEKELAQIEAEFQKQREEGNLPEDLDPEKAYDPTTSIYDNLSCETTDKKNNKRINKMDRQKQLKEQERIDAETFGLSFNNSGYSNNYANRNFPNKPFRNNTNYNKGPNPSHRQHNQRQQYTPKGQQKKVFRVKNTNEQD